MEIRLTILEAIIIVVASLLGGILLSTTLDGNLDSGFIYFGLVMLAVGMIIIKNRASKKR